MANQTTNKLLLKG